MVGFVYDPTVEEDKGEFNQPLELKQSVDPLDFTLPDIDFDFNFDFSKDWIEEFSEPYSTADLKPDLDAISSERIELEVVDKSVEMGESGGDEFEKLGTLSCVRAEPDGFDSGKVEFGFAVKSNELGEGVIFKDVKIEEPVGDEYGKLGTFDCFVIEEEMGKVSLEGAPNGLVAVDADANRFARNKDVEGVDGSSMNWDIKHVDGDVVDVGSVANNREVVAVCGNSMSDEIENFGGDDVKNGEMVGGVTVMGGEVVSNDGKMENGNKNCAKGNEIGSDEDDSNNESESETTSSSSTCSLSSLSDGDEEKEEESGEEEDEEERDMRKGKLKEKVDIEEGEIRDSDVDEMVAWSDADEDEYGGIVTSGPIRSKNELMALPPVPPVNVSLQPYHQILPVGVILSIICSQVIVEGVDKHNPLNEGSILWITEQRSPLGIVDEIFGPVKKPYYVVRYNTESEVPPGIQEGSLISFVPEFANHVLNDKNLCKKGYDASGENDEEVLDEAEFSDDEKEAEYKRMLKMTKRSTSDQKSGNRRKDKKKFKIQGGNKGNDQHSAIQGQACLNQFPHDQKQNRSLPVTTSLDHDSNFQAGPGQRFASGPAFLPPFSQFTQAPGLNAPSNGIWTSGSCQQPQTVIVPNGFPTNMMPWLPQNSQQPCVMPLPNGMPFQQHIDVNQGMLNSFVFPGGQLNFGIGPAFATLPASLGQSGFGQPPFVNGLTGQQGQPSMDMGGPPNALKFGHNTDLQPQFMSGSTEAPQNFEQGKYSGRGRKPRHRGGRFGGARGRQQPN